MKKIEILIAICTILQIVGFFGVIIVLEKKLKNINVYLTLVISLCGFAGIVNYLILSTSTWSIMGGIGGVCLIIGSFITAKNK
jgi:cyanate permease